jgi:hypothetical protein
MKSKPEKGGRLVAALSAAVHKYHIGEYTKYAYEVVATVNELLYLLKDTVINKDGAYADIAGSTILNAVPIANFPSLLVTSTLAKFGLRVMDYLCSNIQQSDEKVEKQDFELAQDVADKVQSIAVAMHDMRKEKSEFAGWGKDISEPIYFRVLEQVQASAEGRERSESLLDELSLIYKRVSADKEHGLEIENTEACIAYNKALLTYSEEGSPCFDEVKDLLHQVSGMGEYDWL